MQDIRCSNLGSQQGPSCRYFDGSETVGRRSLCTCKTRVASTETAWQIINRDTSRYPRSQVPMTVHSYCSQTIDVPKKAQRNSTKKHPTNTTCGQP
eukprot:4086344-Amphidinium_carterae.1